MSPKTLQLQLLRIQTVNKNTSHMLTDFYGPGHLMDDERWDLQMSAFSQLSPMSHLHGWMMHKNKKWPNVVRRKPMRTQYSAPATHRPDLLAHRQSENPMAQTSDGPPPQTSHAQSDPTASIRLRKLPTHLNTPNIFVPDLVRVSPNASDVQLLGRCVGALAIIHTWAHPALATHM